MMRARLALVALLGFAVLGAKPTPEPSPPAFTLLPTQTPETPEPVASGALGTPDPEGERYYAQARAVWRARTDLPFIHYGALIRYEHNKHVFDNWWDAYYRTSDGSIALKRLVDVDEDRRRLRGIPFSIFGVTIFDTNRDSEPIELDDPRIAPVYSFEIGPSFGVVPKGGLAPEIVPEPVPTDSSGLHQIALVASRSGAYFVRYVGTSRIGDVDAVHLTFTPLHDPKIDRLRELWMDPATGRTMELRVQGILSGKPYDGASWIVHYVELDGRNYLQQIVADGPLHFGLNTTIPRLEFDFFDYHFPATVPPDTFGSKIF
jgi:hypothetical protein